jgi:hypothetical protein
MRKLLMLVITLAWIQLSVVIGQPTTTKIHSAWSHAEMAVKFLEGLQPSERKYIRFLSFYNYDVEGILTRRVKSQKFWVNNLHFEQAVAFPYVVEGSEKRLYWIDLREFNWSPEDWQRVARREPYFREPLDSATAILLRRYIEVEQDPKSMHLEAIVRADWFFRETFESDRSPSYYDLLFSKFHKRAKSETYEEIVTPATQDSYQNVRGSDGRIYRQLVKGKPAVTRTVTKNNNTSARFPQNENDFERVFGVDKFRDMLKEFKIDTRHGAVVEGSEKSISIVARQNRLIERIQTPISEYYKTFDVKETAGRRDFAETLNKDFEFDAGEILTGLPSGGMAALLVDNKGAIVETADNRFAIDTSDLKYDARVRTPGSCFICHEQKYIKPKNLIEDMLKSGIDIKFKQKQRAIEARGFFLDWVDKLENEQSRFEKFILRTSGYRAGENALALKTWRDEYDAPVTKAIAAKELGLPENIFKLIAAKSTKARILMLAQGDTIPRVTWEKDGYFEMLKLIDSSKKPY